MLITFFANAIVFHSPKIIRFVPLCRSNFRVVVPLGWRIYATSQVENYALGNCQFIHTCTLGKVVVMVLEIICTRAFRNVVIMILQIICTQAFGNVIIMILQIICTHTFGNVVIMILQIICTCTFKNAVTMILEIYITHLQSWVN